MHTPQFWADILSNASLDMMNVRTWESRYTRFEFLLAHSSPQPFDLTLRGFPAPVAKALAPHAHRILSMTLEIEASEVQELDRLFSVGMPLLEELSIVQLQRPERKEAECNERFATPIHLGPSKYPRLHTLHIPRSLFTTANAVPTIRYLELARCICTDCLYTTTQTINPLLDALEQCPALETLDFEDSSLPSHDNKPPPAPGRIVRLPALRQLVIDDHSPRISTLLSHIDYPANTSVTIAGVRFRREGDNFKRALPSDLTRFHPIMEASEVAVDFGETTVLEAYAGERQVLKYTITEFEGRNRYDGDEPMRYVSELADMFRPVRSVTILTINGGLLLQKDWACLLAAFPNLFCLNTDGFDGAYGLVPALTQSPRTGGCLCPALEKLNFVWNYTSDLRCSKTADVHKIRKVVGRMKLPPPGDDDSDDGSRVSYDSVGVPVYHYRQSDPWGYDRRDDDSDEEDRDAQATRMAGNWKPDQAAWEAEEWDSSYPAVAFFGDMIAAMLKNRVKHGKRLETIAITVPKPRGWYSVLWSPAKLQQKLAKRVDGLVGRLTVWDELDDD